jgi:hypothetical protein
MTTDAKTECVASAAPPLPVSSIRDNYRRGTVGGFLREKIREDSKLSVVSAYFTIYAYEALRDTLDQIDHLDFLFGEPTYVNRLDPDKTAKKSFVIDEDGLELANRLQQKRVAKDCSEWIERKEDIRTIKQSNLLHGKMYHVANGGVEEAILGSSNFTVAGLGLGSSAGNNIELNLVVDSSRDRAELKPWFTEIWNNRGLVRDVKEDVLHHTDLSRESGNVSGVLLESLNWGAYDLVVIDESHNFRNNKLATQRPGDTNGRRSRYQRLMEDIISSGVKTKVLLLSATPVNNQLADLRNQISFIAGGDVARDAEADAAFTEKLNILSVKETSRLAQTQFTNWAKRPPATRRTRELIAAIGGDFFVHDDGTVRFGFAQPKESMLLLRDLAAGEPTAFEKLCDIFDQRTEDGANMTHYDGLLKKALASIEHTFQKRAASSLLTSRDAVLPAATETPTSDGGDFDLVTWLVILGGSTS